MLSYAGELDLATKAEEWLALYIKDNGVDHALRYSETAIQLLISDVLYHAGYDLRHYAEGLIDGLRGPDRYEED